jgi:hypothetical protein
MSVSLGPGFGAGAKLANKIEQNNKGWHIDYSQENRCPSNWLRGIQDIVS